MTRIAALFVVTALGLPASSFAQTPQPFPRPGEPAQPQRPAAPPATSAPPATPAPAPPRTASPAPAQTSPAAANPTAASPATGGLPVYPSAQIIGSYDAGRGQRYLLYGTTASFTDTVTYYRTQLDEKGTLVFKEPPTHMFEVGRFREESMAFPPGVTVKDWTWGGSAGYPNPKLGGQPARFPTVIMIVPPPPPIPAQR